VLLVCPHSPRWPTLTCCTSALIRHAGVLLLHVSRLTSFLLTYIRTCGRNAVLGIGGLHLVRVACLSSFAALGYSYALLVCPHSPRWCTAPTRFSFDLVFADLHSDRWQKRRVMHRWPTSRTCCLFVHIRHAGLLVRIARLPSFSLLANISYRLLVGPHSPHWLTVPMRRSLALILHAGLLLLRVARLTLFSLNYILTFGRNTVLGIGSLHLVRVAHLSSFAALAYSYALLVCPHSPCWPTSRTGCSSALIHYTGLLLLRVARLTSFLLTYIRMCGRNAVFGIGGLHLVHVACLSSFAALAHSYALLVFPHSPCWPTSPTRSTSALILPYLLLVSIARLPSFSLLANISYLLLVGPHSLRWPTACTRSVSALILPYLLLVRVARLPLFSSLAYILYALLVCPHGLPYVPRTSRLDLGCWTLYHNVYIYCK